MFCASCSFQLIYNVQHINIVGGILQILNEAVSAFRGNCYFIHSRQIE